MAVATWLGGTSDDFNVAANWSPAAVPSNGDTLIFNDLAQQGIFVNLDAATSVGKAFDVLVAPGFQFGIGTSALPFEAAEGFPLIVYQATTLVPAFFSADAAKTITRAVVDTSSTTDNLVTFQGAGSTTQVIVRQGKAALASTTITSGGRIEVTGSQPGSPAELNIPTGITLTAVDIGLRSGTVNCSSDCINVNASGGEFNLKGGADMTALLLTGGTCNWDAFDVSSPSTIGEAEILGGTFRIREDRAGRTLTNMNYYTGGTVDFKTGGLNVTYTNAPRNLGGTWITPVGTSLTLAV